MDTVRAFAGFLVAWLCVYAITIMAIQNYQWSVHSDSTEQERINQANKRAIIAGLWGAILWLVFCNLNSN